MIKESKHEYLKKIRIRYKKENRTEKAFILDEFCNVCGYNRKYAIRLLNEDEENKKGGSSTKRGLKRKYAHPDRQNYIRYLAQDQSSLFKTLS